MNELFYYDLELIRKDEKQFEAYNSMSNTAVIAGPGSGKTRVLALKTVLLAKSFIHKPSGLACISYSRETVRELKKRLKLYGYRASSKDFIGTVHSFSLIHVLMPFAHLYPQYQVTYPLKILPTEVQRNIYSSVLNELNADARDIPLIAINRHRSLSSQGLSIVNMTSPAQVIKAAKLYESKLKATPYLDFVSIINISAKMIHEQEFVRYALRCRFPWLLIDEYQDLGKALHEMVLELALNSNIRLFAVGDMNQSIYGFNGGYPEFLQELMSLDDVKSIILSNNYRSNQHIILASLETLLPTPPIPVYVAQLRTDEAPDFTFISCPEEMEPQYDTVAKKVIPKLIDDGVSLNEIGIITGSNDQVKAMARSLRLKQIPFYISKWDFENSAVVVWLQECADWCVNKMSQSFDYLFKFWKRLVHEHDLPYRDVDDIVIKVKLHTILTNSFECISTYDWLHFIINELKLKELLFSSEQYPNESENLDILINEAKLHNLKDTTLSRFAKLGAPDDEVTITTRHSAKGLEFEVVIMLGMEEEKFPFWAHLGNEILLAEDQRVCYVCVSRAKKACILLRSDFYTIDTRRGPWRKAYSPSRFWIALNSKFGTAQNRFTSDNYL
jgi:DNA helicase II / ATP-dependent DNA helicase PcrA